MIIANTKLTALLDSGASRTCVGPKLAEVLGTETFKTSDAKSIVLANKAIEKISGQILLPDELNGARRELAIRLVKSLADDCVFGVDALNEFDIQMHFGQKYWQMGDGPRYYLQQDDYAGIQEEVAGISKLTDNETEVLRNLLEELIPATDGKLGTTHLAKHAIDVQGNKPIKQRYYLVSPKVNL